MLFVPWSLLFPCLYILFGVSVHVSFDFSCFTLKVYFILWPVSVLFPVCVLRIPRLVSPVVNCVHVHSSPSCFYFY